MINLKEMLMEDRNSASTRKGCLMAMIPKEATDAILKFNKQLIKEEDLYLENNEYGRESECHVTIRYGFLKDLNELDVRQLLKGHKPFMTEIYGLDKFDSSPKYDVAMFKVNSPVLKQLNELSGIYLNESDYSEYTPHMTLAYVKKGKFPHVKGGFKLKIPITEICYAPISGEKSYFTLEEDINSKIVESLNESIVRLTKEDAQEVSHKIEVLNDNPDGQEDYGITQEQATLLAHSIPHNGGEWNIPDWAILAVKGEMKDHVIVLRDIAQDAYNGGQTGQSLRINKQAKRLEMLFSNL